MNSTVENQLLAALNELDATVSAMARNPAKPDLLKLFARIDGYSSQLPANTDPTLMHYLHKKSYQKARLYLLGRDAENQAGNCRHI